MISLFAAEMRKVWRNRLFLLLLAILAAGNLLLLWMGTQPTANRAAPAAYRAVGRELAGMTMEEKGDFLQRKLQTAEDLLLIDRFYKGELYGLTPGEYREDNAAAFARSEELYKDKGYALYTGNFSAEVKLLRQLWEEYQTVRDYPQFLQETQDKAVQLSGISIFQQGSSSGYNSRVIRATADVYAGMGQIPLCYFPQQGVYTALQYPFTDIILLASMLLLALFLVRSERDSGLLQLIRTLPGGRLRTALAKLATLTLSILVITVLLYGVNLFYCELSFGLGPLDRNIQSVPALLRCTIQVTVREYLFLFLLAKWAGASVMGMGVLLAALTARHPLAGWLGAAALPLGMYGVRALIPAAGKLNVLKYANLASLLQTNELLGRYRCLYWFGSPLPLFGVEWTAAVLYAAAFGGGFCLLMAHGTLAEHGRLLPLPIRHRKTKPTSLWREEGHKLWAMQGAAAMLAVFLAFGVYQGVTAESYITAEEYFYAEYLKPVSGPYTEQSRETLVQMGEEFIPLAREMQQVESGQEMSDAAFLSWNLLEKYKVYSRVIRQNVNAYLSQHPGAWLVYDTGYRKLFGLSGNGDVQDALYAGALCALCFGGLFALERRGGMDTVLRCTPRGQIHTVRAKLLHSCLLGTLIALAVCLPHFWQVLRDYGLPAILAPALSISAFEQIPAGISLLGILLFWLLCRVTACILMGFGMLWLGYRLKSTLAALLAGTAAYCLPALLSLSGMKGGIEWLSSWPLFHAAALLTPQGSMQLSFAWVPLLVLGMSFVLLWAIVEDLRLRWSCEA